MEKAKKIKFCKRLIHKQLLQVLFLRGTPFRSYLTKHFKKLYRALYGEAMLVFLKGTTIWRPEINKKKKHLEFTFAMKLNAFFSLVSYHTCEWTQLLILKMFKLLKIITKDLFWTRELCCGHNVLVSRKVKITKSKMLHFEVFSKRKTL